MTFSLPNTIYETLLTGVMSKQLLITKNVMLHIKHVKIIIITGLEYQERVNSIDRTLLQSIRNKSKTYYHMAFHLQNTYNSADRRQMYGRPFAPIY